MLIRNYHHSKKYITAQEFNKLTAENFAARLTQVLLQMKHVDAEKKIADSTNKVAQILEKRYDVLLGKMRFTGNSGYQYFLVFTPMLSSLILDSNKKVTNWMLT